MATLYLVRHGEAAAAWNQSRDPGLSEAGREQAERLAAQLRPGSGAPPGVVTSPLQRARETAAPLAARWGVAPVIEPAVAEVPSPGLSLEERGAWLRRLLDARWTDADPSVRQWQQDAVAALRGYRQDTVIVTHAVLINAVVAAVSGDENVLVFRPDYCSVTVLRHERGALRVMSVGGDAETRLL